jgi:hypothetical protein
MANNWACKRPLGVVQSRPSRTEMNLPRGPAGHRALLTKSRRPSIIRILLGPLLRRRTSCILPELLPRPPHLPGIAPYRRAPTATAPHRDCSQRSCSCCGPDTTRATRLTNRCRRGSLSLSAGGGGNGGSIARTVTVVSARLFLDRACTTARPGLRPVSTP